MSEFLGLERNNSDSSHNVAVTDCEPVMASSSTQNVVNSSQSMGESSPVDAHATNNSASSAANGILESSLSSVSEGAAAHGKNTTLGTQNTSAVDADSHGQAFAQTSSLANAQMANGAKPEQDSAPTDQEQGLSKDETDLSVGSDTDTSRDAQGRDSKSASIKKPASFKPVSVTRNFLAKAVNAPVVAKTGEKGPIASPVQSVAKPRLVAKSGSGLRDIPRVRSGTEGPTDGATVWNKNRPVAPAPPKHFTDEELKQRYGIHLATRLQTDEAGEKSKWADIDDEEDDWVPEPVEWMDGTKSNIVSAENQPIPVEEPQAAILRDEELTPPPTKPTLTALKRPSVTGPPRTILRPGAAQKQDGGTLRGGVDQKPTLVSKSPAPPVKSPWASLPPVEKASPVFQPPAVPQQSSVFGQRDPHGFDAMSSPAAAREMETDTFDRSWREGERGGRELFNSQSGRYEPAPDRRRGSIRQDHGSRQPALLQRPSQQDTGAPAGPSAAFQTRSSGQLDGSPWSRRRGSSVSGTGSIPYERRLSLSKGPEISSPVSETRSAIVIGHDVSPRAPSVSAQAPPQIQQPVPTEATSVDEEVARQKKIMQEKRDAAIKRRKEADEREEAARKERIRAKMESLGLPPLESKEATNEPTPAAVTQPKAQTVDKSPATLSGNSHPSNIAAKIAESEQDGATQASVQVGQHRKAGQSETEPQLAAQSNPTLPSPLPLAEASQVSLQGQQSPMTPARSPYQPAASLHGVAPSSYSSPGEQKPQPAWKSPALGPDSFATWGNSNLNSHTAPSASVWGPPTASRRIGNGAFESNYPSFPRLSQQGNGVLSPSGSFARQPNVSRVSPHFGQQDQPAFGQQLRSEPQVVSIGMADTISGERLTSQQSNVVSPASNSARQYQPGPIAPPQRVTSRAQPSQPLGQRGASAWGQFAAQAQIDAVQHATDPTARRTESQEDTTQSPGPSQQRWKETFKQTKARDDWLGGPREIMAMEKTVHGGNSAALSAVTSPAPPVSQTKGTNMQPISSDSGPQNTVKLPNGPSGLDKPFSDLPNTAPRSGAASLQPANMPQQSRFFPSSVYGGSPPPEELDHPVHSGDANRPLVNIPAPKPQVRLPPSASNPALQSSPVLTPQRMPSFRVGAQPLVQSSDWQARFNGLFGRIQTTTATPPSPPGTPPKAQTLAEAISASSGADFFVEPESDEATVSLPRSLLFNIARHDVEEGYSTKTSVDEIFDGELSFGSIPKVFLPRGVIYPGAFAGGRMLNSRPNSKFQRSVDVQSIEVKAAYLEEGKLGDTVTIHLPLSRRPAKDITFSRKTKDVLQNRKASAKFNKNKRGENEAKITASSPSISASASPGPKGKESRQPSLQKQSPQPTQTPDSQPSINGNAGNTQTTQRPKGKWAKPTKGRNAPNKSPVGV